MLTTLIKSLFAVFVTMSLLACNNSEKTSESLYIMVHTLKGGNSQKISDQAKISQLQKAWQEKRVVKLKRAPSYDYTVSLHEGDNSEAWLVSASGYVRAQEGGGDYYKVELPEFLASDKKTQGGKK